MLPGTCGSSRDASDPQADASQNENLYALDHPALTTLYAIKGGMFSVVFTEVMQFLDPDDHVAHRSA